MKIELPQHLWHGNTTLEITVPDEWDVEMCAMKGADRKPLSDRQIEEAINSPFGSPGIRELAGLDFKIDALFNARGEITAVFSGDFMEAHAEGVKLAKEIYDTDPRPRDKDLVISNAFAKPNEMAIAMVLGARALRDFSGPVVIMADSPEGQVVHYLLGRFGQNFGGRQYPIGQIPDSLKLIIQAPHFDKTFADWYVNPEVITFTQNWDQTLEIVGETIGFQPKVAVIPSATMQYFSS